MFTRKRLFLILVGAGLLFTFLVAIPREMLFRPENAVVGTPLDVGVAYEDITLSPADRSLNLAGWWMAADEPAAVLLFIHGGGSNRHSEFIESLGLYRSLVDRGISVLAIDLRNHGASGSDGRGMQFGRTEKSDVTGAITWARQREPTLPLFAMGASMGGATVIHAAADGAPVDGLILLDPALDTHSTLQRGGWVETGLPSFFFAPAAWAATSFYGLPGGDEQALERAAGLNLPILLIQDPRDPVTLDTYARRLAGRNTAVKLWHAPETPDDHPDIAWKGRWGSHVAAFALYPGETLEQIMGFIAGVTAR